MFFLRFACFLLAKRHVIHAAGFRREGSPFFLRPGGIEPAVVGTGLDCYALRGAVCYYFRSLHNRHIIGHVWSDDSGDSVVPVAYLIISSVQLGATVDYAILFSDRYQEFRETLGRKEAVAATVSAVTTSVSTTGSAMAVVGFLMGAISTNQLLGQLGNFLGVGSLVSLAIVLSALPGFLYLADPLIIKKKKQPKEA